MRPPHECGGKPDGWSAHEARLTGFNEAPARMRGKTGTDLRRSRRSVLLQ